jgi:hypothetical protein
MHPGKCGGGSAVRLDESEVVGALHVDGGSAVGDLRSEIIVVKDESSWPRACNIGYRKGCNWNVRCWDESF